MTGSSAGPQPSIPMRASHDAAATAGGEGAVGARIFAAIAAAVSGEPPKSRTFDDNECTPDRSAR